MSPALAEQSSSLIGGQSWRNSQSEEFINLLLVSAGEDSAEDWKVEVCAASTDQSDVAAAVAGAYFPVVWIHFYCNCLHEGGREE